MGDHSKIEWTEATWNPVVGCRIVSPGCTNCYAMKDAWRKNANPRLPRYHGLTKMTKGGPVWTGEVRTVPELLDWPLRKRKPLRIFVNSMSDLFHEDVDTTFIGRLFNVMGTAKQHIFQVLTKRAQRMHDVVAAYYKAIDAEPYPNVWLGVSVEDQARADERIPLLLQTPAAVRWISAEPLLGPVELRRYLVASTVYEVGSGRSLRRDPGLNWVVVGGESGPGARPFDIAWARSLREQCRAAGVPYFLKQIGSQPRGWCAWHLPWHIGSEEAARQKAEDTDGDCDNYEASEQAQPCSAYGHRCIMLEDRKGGDPAEWPEDLRVREYPA